MKANLLAAVFASVVLTGCAVWVVQPPTKGLNFPVTSFQVRFNPDYQPGTFKAYLDGNDITSLFSPAGVAGGKAAASWNQPYEGGYDPNTGILIVTPQGPAASAIYSQGGGSLGHKLRVEGRCLLSTICIQHDEVAFTPINYVATPIPLKVPVGKVVSMQLRADRDLAAPLFVTVQPMLLDDPRGLAAHVQVDRAPPGMPANVLIPAGRALAVVSVAGLGRGGFLLKFSAPGTQVGQLTGVVE